MEKRDRREQEQEEVVQEGDGIQDSEIVPEHRQSSQQLQQTEGSAQNESSELRATNKIRKSMHRDKAETGNNIATRDTSEKAVASGSTSQRLSKLQLFERSQREYVARAHAAQQGSVFREEQSEPERNTTVQQRGESSANISIARARDSIQASENVEQKCDRNVHFDVLLDRRIATLTKLLDLSSKQENKKVKIQRTVKHQSNIASEVALSGVRNEETSVEKQQSIKLLSDFLQRHWLGNRKEKEPLIPRHITTTGESEGYPSTLDQQENKTDYPSQSQDGTSSISSNSIDNSFTLHLGTKDTKLKYDKPYFVTDTCRHKSKFERIQSEAWDGNKTSDAGASPKDKSGSPTTPAILSSNLKQVCKVLYENAKVKEQPIVTHQASIEPGSFLSIRTQTGAEKVETSANKQQLLKMMSVFFKHQQMVISNQENKNTSASLDEIEPQKLVDKTTSGESIDKQNVCPRNYEKKTIDCQDSASLLQNSKVHSYDIPFNSQQETESLPKTKDYVTALPRESDATKSLRNPKDLETSIPDTSNNYKSSSSQWKNYITEHSSDQRENARMPPRPLPEMTRRATKKVQPIPGIEGFHEIPTRVFWPLKHSPEKDQKLEEEKRNILFPNRYGTSFNQADDSLLLVPLEERQENTAETGVQRHGGISSALLLPLQIGIRGCIQRIREHHMSSERCGFCETIKSGCIIVFCSVIIGSVLGVVAYFVVVFSM